MVLSAPPPFWTMLKKCRISKEGHPFHSLDIYANSQFESEESHHHQVLTPGPHHSILIISTEWEKLGGKTLFSTHDQDFYQTHYMFQLYPSITFNVRLVGVYWTLDSWAGRRLGILVRLSLLWNWSGSFLDLLIRVAKTCRPCRPVGAIFSGRC